MAYVFNIGAGVDGDDVAVLDSEVVAHNTVDADASVIQVIVRQNNKNGILSLLSFHEDLLGSRRLADIQRLREWRMKAAYSITPE